MGLLMGRLTTIDMISWRWAVVVGVIVLLVAGATVLILLMRREARALLALLPEG